MKSSASSKKWKRGDITNNVTSCDIYDDLWCDSCMMICTCTIFTFLIVLLGITPL
jgi:hypothetical protein